MVAVAEVVVVVTGRRQERTSCPSLPDKAAAAAAKLVSSWLASSMCSVAIQTSQKPCMFSR